MDQTIEAVYENGILRPKQPLVGVKEHASIQITFNIPETTKSRFEGLDKISDEDAQEMIRVIEAEFEQVDPDEWK